MSHVFFMPAAAPKNELGRYRRLAPSAGVHVSPIQLGAMSIGERWSDLGMGSMDKESSFKLLDAYFDNGGNFIDTAPNYHDEQSEEFIGEWAEKRDIRDQLFIATKYTSSGKQRNPAVTQGIFYTGNNVKSMNVSIEGSLKRLRTHYIDLFYVHWWDWSTPVEEVMRGLNYLVASGKVLYLGISDTPAWVVAKANQYARDHGLAQFTVYQGNWNILERSFERDIIPMARAEGMALAPFGVLAGGKIRSDQEEERRRETGEKGRTFGDPNWERNEQELKASKALQQIATEVGAKHITSIAIAYVMQKAAYVFPIVGGRKVDQLLANTEALTITLTPEHIKLLESVKPLDPGFPSWMIGDGTSQPLLFKSCAPVAPLIYQQSLKPSDFL